MPQKFEFENIAKSAHPMTKDFLKIFLLDTLNDKIQNRSFRSAVSKAEDIFDDHIFLMEEPVVLHNNKPYVAAIYKFESMTAAVEVIRKLTEDQGIDILIYSVHPYEHGIIVRMVAPDLKLEIEPVKEEEEARRADEEMLTAIRNAFPEDTFSLKNKVLLMNDRVLSAGWNSDCFSDITALHGVDVLNEIKEYILEYIKIEIDAEKDSFDCCGQRVNLEK